MNEWARKPLTLLWLSDRFVGVVDAVGSNVQISNLVTWFQGKAMWCGWPVQKLHGRQEVFVQGHQWNRSKQGRSLCRVYSYTADQCLVLRQIMSGRNSSAVLIPLAMLFIRLSFDVLGEDVLITGQAL